MKKMMFQIVKFIFAGFLISGGLQYVSAADTQKSQSAAAQTGKDKVFLNEEKLLIGRGEKHTLELIFTPTEVTTTSSCIKVEQISSRVFEITALSTGSARLSFISNQTVKNYYILITGSNLQVYRELVRDFANCPEISVERTSSEVILSGTIFTIENWEHFQRIMRKGYEGVKNYVIFRPGRKLYDELKKQLAADGFHVEKDYSPDKPGVVRFSISNETLSIAGFFNNTKDIERVKRIVSLQKWLDPVWNKNNFKVSLELMEVDTQIEVSIVFVGVQRKQIKEWGNYNANGVLMSWDLGAWIRALAGGARSMYDSTSGAYASLSTDISGSLKFFAENGITDYRDAGHVTITNNGPVAEYTNGGTRYVKVSGTFNGDLKEMDYGVKYKVKGHFVRNGIIHLELDLERALEPVREGTDYDERKMTTKTALNCPINKTAVIAGQVERNHEKDGPTGYGILRHIPIVNWVMGYGKYDTSDNVYIILIYPEITSPDKVKLTQKPSDITKEVDKEATAFIEPEVQAIRKNEQKNWFKRMFTW